MQFKYKITKFDSENKIVVVTFDDGSWAEIRLANPLPSNIEELEIIIKRYTAPKEVIEAKLSPSADLSYIDQLIDVERTADRFSIFDSIQKVTDSAPPQADKIPVTVI